MRRLHLLASLAALAIFSAGASERASAQAELGTGFPSKPIRFVVGYAAGGGNDIFARLVGDKVREFLGQPVVIENKPGGGGRLAGEYVMGQPADGYTVLVGAAGMMALVPVIYPRTGYHPTRTYTPLSMIASFPLILAVPGSHPARSLAELVAWAKAHPDKANYATSSPAFTITTELLKLKTGMPGVPIPYKSTNEMMVSVASEQAHVACTTFVPSGDFRVSYFFAAVVFSSGGSVYAPCPVVVLPTIHRSDEVHGATRAHVTKSSIHVVKCFHFESPI